MKYLVFSDIHTFPSEQLIKLFEKFKNYNKICLGDYGPNEDLLKKYKVTFVVGNTDFKNEPLNLSINVNGKKTVLTHGHKENVKNDLLKLYYLAVQYNAAQVFFGHTHSFLNIYYKDILFLNPGSLKNGEYVTINDDVITKRSVFID